MREVGVTLAHRPEWASRVGYGDSRIQAAGAGDVATAPHDDVSAETSLIRSQ